MLLLVEVTKTLVKNNYYFPSGILLQYLQLVQDHGVWCKSSVLIAGGIFKISTLSRKVGLYLPPSADISRDSWTRLKI